MKQYWLNEPGKQTTGPFTVNQLEAKVKSNSVSLKGQVCEVGNIVWMPLRKIVEVTQAFGLIQPNSLIQPPNLIQQPSLIQQSGLIQPPAMEAGKKQTPAFISPPALPTRANPNFSNSNNAPALPIDSNNQKVKRQAPILALLGLVGGIILLLMSGVMLFIFGVVTENPVAEKKPIKVVEDKKPEPIDNQKIINAALIHRQKVWDLKIGIFKKTITLLQSEEAIKALSDLGSMGKEAAEEKVWQYLSERIGQGFLTKAAELIKELPPEALEEFKNFTPIDLTSEMLTLQWLTYEALEDYGYLLKIWQEHGKDQFKNREEIINLFKGLKERPSLEKGIESDKNGNQSIKVKMYGSNFEEKVVTEPAGNGFASSFQVLCKELGRKNLLSGDTVFTPGLDGKPKGNFTPAVKFFVNSASKTIWLTPLVQDSTNAGALLVANRNPVAVNINSIGTAVPGNQKLPLQELFSKLAPSVPLIINPGIGVGSGFLVNYKNKYYVVTNRHVVEGAKQKGVTVKFFNGGRTGNDKSFEINPSIARIVNFHNSADLALIDVHGARNMLEEQSIKPVPLSPKKHTPQVGENVFAIGHPGGGDKILTRTLSNGIISAIGRKVMNSMFLQVTVPLNPGNSGGPLFDDYGRVIGINTFIIRKSSDRGGIALEALNFALEIPHLYELLDKNHDNLVMNPEDEPTKNDETNSNKKMGPAIAELTKVGYKPLKGTLAKSSQSFNLGPGGSRVIEFEAAASPLLAVTSGSVGSEDIDLAVIDKSNESIATEDETGDAPSLTFRCKPLAALSLIVFNPTDKSTVVTIAFWTK